MKKSLLLISLFTLSLASFTSCALDNQQSSKVDSNNVLLLQAATGINMIKDVKTFRNARSVETKNTALSEEEYNGKKSENSYSFSTFNSYSDYIIDEDNFVEKIEYEIENNDINVEIETINSEIEFIDITKINENSYSFCVDEYLSSLNNEITNVLISLLYNEDNSRTYSYKNLIITKK